MQSHLGGALSASATNVRVRVSTLILLCAAALLSLAAIAVTPAVSTARAAPPGSCGDPPPPPLNLLGLLELNVGPPRFPWIPGQPPSPFQEIEPPLPYVPPVGVPTGSLVTPSTTTPALFLLTGEQASQSQDGVAGALRSGAKAGVLSVPGNGPINYEGDDDVLAGGTIPDPHGGVGTDYFLEILNNRISIFDKYTGHLFIDKFTNPTINDEPTHDEPTRVFFAQYPDRAAVDNQYKTEPLTDPRAVKDPLTGRWIAIALGEVDPVANTEKIHISVSTTEDARRSWYYIQPITISVAPGERLDYPELGVNRDAIIITAFRGAGGVSRTTILTFGKQKLYLGSKVCGKEHAPVNGLYSPPIVRDDNATAFFLAPEIRDPMLGQAPATSLHMLAGTSLGDPLRASITQRPDVAVADSYVKPRSAQQCGEKPDLPVREGRFVNASTQVGRSLWQVHTVAAGSDIRQHPRPRFYELDISAVSSSAPATVRRTGQLFASASSNDHNASIVADAHDVPNGDSVAFVTWSSNVPASGCGSGNVTQIRYDAILPGETSADLQQVPGAALPPTSRGPGGLENEEAWGDYSSITIDPTADATSILACKYRAWLVNELGNGEGWRTQWAAVGSTLTGSC